MRLKHWRQFTTGTLVFALGQLWTLSATATEPAEDADVLPYLITVGEPFDPAYANAGANLRTGVGSLFIVFDNTAPSGFLCTGSAIDSTHILTAAHCVRNAGGLVTSILFFASAGQTAPIIRPTVSFAVHPSYDATEPFYGAFAHGDVAVIELAGPLPASVETYDLYTDTDELGKETRHYGHGRSGKGNKGATGGADFFYARTGLNQYEQVLEPFFGDGIEDQLLHDFDSGGKKHNAMEWWFTSAFACHPANPNNPPWAQDGQCTTFYDGSYPDFKGFGKFEVGIAPGDSGGPGFIDGKIAGIHSFGFTHFCEGVTNGTDFTCGLDSSYGEMAGDTRVSSYALWIDSTVSGAIPSTAVPEPIPGTTASAPVPGGILLSARASFFMGNVFSRTLEARVTPVH